jgi:tripartite-type tricarboxylate transporter receptor subunit TctC
MDAPAIQDLVAGQIDMAIPDPVVTLPQVRAGTIKAPVHGAGRWRQAARLTKPPSIRANAAKEIDH